MSAQASWRAAGMNYLQFSNIAARCVRRALKPEKSQNVLNREGQVMKMTKWSNGKAAEKSEMVGN